MCFSLSTIIMRTAILAALLAAVSTSASILPSLTVRQIDARDFTGTFSSFIKTPLCPEKIKHNGVIEGGNAVAHTNIEIEGKKCDNTGNMNLIPVTQTAKVQETLNNLAEPTKQLATNLYQSAKDVNGSYIGTSGAARTCGNVTLAAGTFFVFVKSDKDFNSGASGLPPFGANMRVMVYIEPGKAYYCAYDAKLRESPSPIPTPIAPPPGATISPVPSVSNETDVNPVPSPSAGSGSEGEADGGAPGVGDSGGENEPGPSPEGRSVCFPGDAKVELLDGTFKTMSKVQIGDMVRVEGNKFSPVFMFTHRLSNVEHEFVRFTTKSGNVVTLTAGHYIKVNGVMRPASSVKVGEMLTLADGKASEVEMVTNVKSVGLFNPQTVEGSIIVNDLVASTYTTAVEMKTAHSLLAPLRALYNAVGVSLTGLETGAGNIASVLPNGAAVY